MKLTALLLALTGTASAIELTPENYEAETAGKTVFIKFLAPWWGHCKKMKPDWDKLMDEFKGSATQLVADGELREGELCDVCADCLIYWLVCVSSHQSRLLSLVDCTAAGKPLCDEVGVRGYPTIKYVS
jgi:thiol-disulfide isomerase/thioredoxin